jgi:hypothetical protein
MSGSNHVVIPGRASSREPGIHNHRRAYGFRACAPSGAHPGMTNEGWFASSLAEREIAR